MGGGGGGVVQEAGDTYVHLWLIHADVFQKPIQYCKAIMLQLKINNFIKKQLNSFIKSTSKLFWSCIYLNKNIINMYLNIYF